MAGDSTDNKTDSLITSVPVVEFVDDVDAFMQLPENAANSQAVLKKMEEIYSKIKVMESNNVNNKIRLKNQIQELEKSIAMLEELKKRKASSEDMSTHFRLADHVFLKAKVPPADKVGLWLGANVMLEYDLEEGYELLTTKKAKAEQSLKSTNALIDHVRENVTTIEVNMARVYNWDVKRRQAEKEKLGLPPTNSNAN
jgi:prefoldin subunit 5